MISLRFFALPSSHGCHISLALPLLLLLLAKPLPQLRLMGTTPTTTTAAEAAVVAVVVAPPVATVVVLPRPPTTAGRGQVNLLRSTPMHKARYFYSIAAAIAAASHPLRFACFVPGASASLRLLCGCPRDAFRLFFYHSRFDPVISRRTRQPGNAWLITAIYIYILTPRRTRRPGSAWLVLHTLLSALDLSPFFCTPFVTWWSHITGAAATAITSG